MQFVPIFLDLLAVLEHAAEVESQIAGLEAQKAAKQGEHNAMLNEIATSRMTEERRLADLKTERAEQEEHITRRKEWAAAEDASLTAQVVAKRQEFDQITADVAALRTKHGLSA